MSGGSPEGVRWDADLEEFQKRCDSCASTGRGPIYWPLTLEFWEPKHGMTRCRACWRRRHAAKVREALRHDPVRYARKLEANREQKRAKNAIYNAQYYPAKMERLRSDPERYDAWKARHREASARYRARLREQAA